MYVSPETLKTRAYYPFSDVWAFGITFYMVATGDYPYTITSDVPELFKTISRQQPEKLNTSNELLNYIVNRSLDKNPITRITLTEIEKLLNN